MFFIYEFAPMMVKRTEVSRSFFHFLTSGNCNHLRCENRSLPMLFAVCAIIGGVYTVAGIVDSLLYHSLNAIKKYELGKAS